MTAIVAPGFAQAPIAGAQWARNGQTPDAQLQQTIADGLNAAGDVRLKEHCRFATALTASPGFDVVERTRWRFAFRTHPFARFLWCRFGFTVQSGYSGGARLHIRTPAGVLVGTATVTGGSGGGGPSGINDEFSTLLTDVGGFFELVEVAPNTIYVGEFEDLERSQLLFASVYESGSDATTALGFVGAAAAGTPILDVDRQAAAELGRKLWHGGGAHLGNFSVEAEPREVAGGDDDYNVIQQAGGAGGPQYAGLVLDLRNRARVAAAGVPVDVWAYGGFPGSTDSEGVVMLIDGSTGNTVAVLDGFAGPPEWRSTSVVLPATLAKYEIVGAVNGADAFHFYAASIFPSNTAVTVPTLVMDYAPTAPPGYITSGSGTVDVLDAFGLAAQVTVGGDAQDVTVQWVIAEHSGAFVQNAVDAVAEIVAANPGWSAVVSDIGAYRQVLMTRAGLAIGAYTVLMPFGPGNVGVGAYSAGGPYAVSVNASSAPAGATGYANFLVTVVAYTLEITNTDASTITEPEGNEFAMPVEVEVGGAAQQVTVTYQLASGDSNKFAPALGLASGLEVANPGWSVAVININGGESYEVVFTRTCPVGAHNINFPISADTGLFVVGGPYDCNILASSVEYGSASPVAYYGVTVTSATPTYTIDGTSGIACPADLTEHAAFETATGTTMGAPDLIWNFQEVSGAIADASGNSRPGTVSGGATYADTVAGWARKGLTLTGGNSVSTINVPNASANSICVVTYAIWNGAITASWNIIVYGTSQVWQVRSSATPRMQHRSSGNIATGTNDFRGSVRPFGLVANRTASSGGAYSDQEKVNAAHLNTPTGASFAIGNPAGTILYAAVWFSAKTEAQLKAWLQAAGWTIPW